MNVLSIKGLTKRYPNFILQDITFELPQSWKGICFCNYTCIYWSNTHGGTYSYPKIPVA